MRFQGNPMIQGTNATLDVSPATATTYVVVITDDGLPAGNNAANAIQTIDVIGAPQLNAIADVNACLNYQLPAITGTNLSGTAVYTDGTNGSGNVYAPGSVINIADFASYPVTLYVYDENSLGALVCANEISFNLSITPSISADSASNVVQCSTYILPSLSLNNSYWSNSGGTGINYNEGDSILSTTTLFIYADNGGCTDENQFTITIDPITADVLPDDTGCLDYILPALSANNAYFTQPNRGGIALNAGESITTTSTIYINAQSISGTATCSDESSFEITITGLAIADNFEDVQECESYTLPTLSPNNRYFDQMGGSGTEYFAGDVISGNIRLYIYAGVPGCSAETDFNIAIETTSVTVSEMEDVRACGNYVLPVISNGRYFTQAQGQGIELLAFGVITSTQTIYIFNESGSCSAESDFIVTIDCSPPEPTTCVRFPKFFSPNLDGANDFFTAIVDGNCNANGVLSIYDRYGKLMKIFNPANDNWDGTYNGSNAPSTDYWYHYIDADTRAVVKGHFTLKR